MDRFLMEQRQLTEITYVTTPRTQPVWLVVAAFGAAAAAVTGFVLPALPSAPLAGGLPWPVLLAGFALAELGVVHIRLGKQLRSFSLDEIPLVLGLFFLDPLTLVAVRLAGRGAVIALHRRQPPLKLAYNLSQWWLEAAIAVALWSTLVTGHDVLGPVGWCAAFAAVLVADLIAATGVATVIAIVERTSFRSLFWESLWTGAATACSNVCLALVAVAVVVVDWRAGWTLVVVGLLFFLAHRAHNILQERHTALERLNRFTYQLSADADVEAVARAVLEEVCGLLGAERAEIVLGDFRVLTRDGAGTIRQTFDVQRSIAHALRGRLLDASVTAPRSTRDPVLRAWLQEVGVRDAITVPLRVDDRVVGNLTVADRSTTDTFGRGDLQVLEALANHAAVAVENARLGDRLRLEVTQKNYQAQHDALTGLTNRSRLQEHIDGQLAAGEPFAVLLLDLDQFKDVNDTLGHAAGDELLCHVASRLGVVATAAGGLLARLGGDEFAVVAPAAGEEAALDVARRVRALVAQTFVVGDVRVSIDASIGIVLAPDHGPDHSALLRRADIAMYAAKTQRTGVEVYSASIDQHTAERLALVAELRAALANRSLTVAYQPKIDLADGRVLGVEALVRWTHPERGFVPPDVFIPVAERTGLIDELTTQVLDAALGQCAEWRRGGLQIGVAVNLSLRVLHAAGFEDSLADLLRRHGVPAELLTLEVTESSLMSDPDGTIAILRRLRVLGVHLSIDDLGTGYSALAYLKRLPVDEIKIDKSFVFRMADDPDDEAIVRAVIDLGHRLRMRVVAEGVEDETTYALLRALGCDVAQGFWMSRPLPVADVATFVADWERTRSTAAV